MHRRYAVVIHKDPDSDWGVHAPDVPGCIAVGETREEALRLFAEALAFHFEGMAEDGDPIPEPTAVVDYVEVELPEAVAAS